MTANVALVASMSVNAILFLLLLMSGRLNERVSAERDAYKLANAELRVEIKRKLGEKKAGRIEGSTALRVEQIVAARMRGDNPHAQEDQ